MLIQNPLNEYSSAFPILECIHIAGIVCGVGTTMLVNLRLLGAGLTRNSASLLWKDLMPWTLSGLSIAIISGLLLLSIDPEAYYLNYAFRFKLLSLVPAIVFYYTLVRKAAASGTPGAKGAVVACISLGLWALVPLGGIFIGFIDSTFA